MNKLIRLYCAQINSTVGDFQENFEKIALHIERAKELNCDIIAFPELAITGYPPEDLVLRPAFIDKNLEYLSKIKNISENITVIVGFISKDIEIYNSAAVINNKKIAAVYNKQFLPNYSVFDEERYFQQGSTAQVFEIKNMLFGVNICEDIFYSSGPLQKQAICGGAILIINISASPYHIGKISEREKLLFTRATDNKVNILYVNLVGGQDELVFDGSSVLINEKGEILYRAKPFEEDYFVFDLDTEEINFSRLQDSKFKTQRDLMRQSTEQIPIIKLKNKKLPSDNKNSGSRNSNDKNTNNNNSGNKNSGNKNNTFSHSTYSTRKDYYIENVSCIEEEIFKALVLGTKDFVLKNGFKKVVLGLSGGIDSALTSVIASFAVGPENTNVVLMPSIYSSEGSINDSLKLIKNIGINYEIIPIKESYSSIIKSLKDKLITSDTNDINITKENLQARLRGLILMALSNEYNWLVLATGNKSEISVGYCTLYGDMVGGFSPIKDIYKTMVYKICNFLNKKYNNIIPENIIKKVPSAELKPNQTDQDKLPPYEILDSILKYYIEEERNPEEIIKEGFNKKIVFDVINMVDLSEYKRRQGAPGIKITKRAFGKDRRYPITNKFKNLNN